MSRQGKCLPGSRDRRIPVEKSAYAVLCGSMGLHGMMGRMTSSTYPCLGERAVALYVYLTLRLYDLRLGK